MKNMIFDDCIFYMEPNKKKCNDLSHNVWSEIAARMKTSKYTPSF